MNDHPAEASTRWDGGDLVVLLRAQLDQADPSWSMDDLMLGDHGVGEFGRDTWTVEVELRLRDGQVGHDGLRLVPPSGWSDVLTLGDEMRRLRLGPIHHQWQVLLRAMVRDRTVPTEWRDGMVRSKRPGRAGHPAEFYARWAKAYVDRAGEVDVQARLAEEIDGETASSIRRYVRRAGELGLVTDLPARGQRRASGRMTDEGLRVLAETES